jgi:hypothetical protein
VCIIRECRGVTLRVNYGKKVEEEEKEKKEELEL